MTFSVGENVGPYRIIAQLGSGGMATVYKAYHASLDRYVAIKVLHPAFKEDPNFLSRFQREARIVAKMEHPHIVPVYDFNEAGGQPYLVMRFIEGETLKARLTKGHLPLTEIVRILQPVGEALTYAHRQGVLHRDVKPSNILLTPEGGVFLADFGLARIAQAGESTLSQDALVGTPQYISPEQAKGEANLDVRTDVYSLGVVMYELLVGQVPYQADTPYAVIHDHIYAPLPLPRSIKPDFPEPLERVLLKALSKERDDRYSSIAELMTAFEQAVQTVSSTVVTPSASATLPASAAKVQIEKEPPRSNRNLWWGLAAVGLIAVVAIAIVLRQARPAVPTPVPPPTRESQPAPQVPPDNPPPQNQFEGAQQLFRDGNLQAAQGNIPAARESFTQAAQVSEGLLGSNPDATRDQRAALDTLAGDSWLAAGQPDRAQMHYEALVNTLPDNPDPLVGLAAAQLLQNHLPDVTATLDKALALQPNLPSAHALRACLLLKQNEPVRAVREFRLANGTTPDNKPLLQPWIKLVLSDLDCGDERFK